RAAGGAPRGRGARSRAGGGPAPLRSRARAAAASRPGAVGGDGPPAAADPASHRVGRLVHRRAAAGGGGSPRGFLAGPSIAVARAAGSVRRLRGLAARLAPGRGAGGAAPLLDTRAGRRAARAGAAHRPPAAGGAELARRRTAPGSSGGVVGGGADSLPARRRDSVH